jgi:hypothetical protein
MDDRTHSTAHGSPADELSEPLRQAVAQVREAAPPAGAAARALEKARRLRAAPPRPRLRRDLAAVAGIVAVFCIGLACIPSTAPDNAVVAVVVDDSESVNGGGGAPDQMTPPRPNYLARLAGDRDNDVTWYRPCASSGDCCTPCAGGLTPSTSQGYVVARPGYKVITLADGTKRLVSYTVCKATVTETAPTHAASKWNIQPASLHLPPEVPGITFADPTNTGTVAKDKPDLLRPGDARAPELSKLPALKDNKDRLFYQRLGEGESDPEVVVLARQRDEAERRYYRDRALRSSSPGTVSDDDLRASEQAWQRTNEALRQKVALKAGLDANKFGELAEVWGHLPEKERGLAVEGLVRDMPPKYRKAVEDYFHTLTGKAEDDSSVAAARAVQFTFTVNEIRADKTVKVDADKLKQLADTWSEQPVEEREKSLKEFQQQLPPKYREVVADYFYTLTVKAEKASRLGGENRAELVRVLTVLAEDKKANVDTDKIKKLAVTWSNPTDGKDKEKELNEVIRDLPPKYREIVQEYFRKLDAQAKGAEKTPEVWHRDAAQPTFARVYVGDGNSLELVSLHVTVTVDGPRARTVVDHVFRNPHDRRLEGTFEYPLPTGASPSYFGMFLGQSRDTMPALFRNSGDAPLTAEALAKLTPAELVKHIDSDAWGKLQEGRIVGQDKGVETYEEVVRGQIDPALLEYAGANTFRGRVFPIQAKGYNRVILAYEELLPVVNDRLLYRFPQPNCELTEMKFTLQANPAECKDVELTPKAEAQNLGGRTLYTKTWSKSKPEGQILFTCAPPQPRVQAISGRSGDKGPQYLYARLRPDLPSEDKEPFARDAVFLLDTSLSEHPDRFGVSMKLLRSILEADGDIRRFNVLTFNAGAAWVEPKGWIANDPKGRDQAFAKLDGIVLEGATDLSAALEKLVKPGFEIKAGTPLNVFVLSDGALTWGETDVNALTARFEQRCPYPCRFFCYRTGLGAENTELFDALTRKGGGVFQCYGQADLAAAAKAHRSHCLQVENVRFEGGPDASEVLLAGRRAAVYPGGELVVAAKMSDLGKTKVVVEGTYRGKKVTREFPIAVGGGSELAARGWGEVAIESLLALHDPSLDNLIVAYCQQYGVASRLASFLVLENEEQYKRFELDKERGAVQGDLGTYLAEAWSALGKTVGGREAFQRFLDRVEPRVKMRDDPQVKKLLGLLADADFELPGADLAGAILKQKDADAAYLKGRTADRRDVRVYLDEAARRAKAGDAAGAVRVLSSIVEENPGRGDALRLVGYRLLDLEQPVYAARLFEQVQRQRPFEPHSYRDLAQSLEKSGKPAWAALQYELVLAGTWHNRFHDDLKAVVREEYARMMQDAVNQKKVTGKLADFFGERLEGLAAAQKPADLRVTFTWNTDATDVDLWVIEPNGEKCFYSHNRTAAGGELSQDQTQGYGPERYQIAKAAPGEYRVVAHYFRPNPNLLGGETHVNVVVTRYAGTPREQTERRTIVLRQHNDEVEAFRVKFDEK